MSKLHYNRSVVSGVNVNMKSPKVATIPFDFESH